MELRPGYKQTEVGVIPEQWATTTLAGACVQGGLVRGPFGGALKKDVFVKTGRKVYEQKNAIQRDATIGSYYIDEAKFQELQRFSVSPGDFIVSCAGTIGRIFRVPTDAKPGVINQALLKLRIDEEVVCSDYFYLYFDWDAFQQRIVDNTHGGAMQNLVGMSLFRCVELGLPPLPEQHAIAGALGEVNALLEGLDRLIAKKRDLKQAAMQQLLTGRTRLSGFSESWKLKPVREAGEVLAGKALNASGPGLLRPYLRTKNVLDGRIDLDDVLQMPMTNDEFERFLVRTGDVLLNEGQSLELVGRCSMYRNELLRPCAMQNQLLRFRPLADTSAEFSAHLFRRCQLAGMFAAIATQTTSVAHLGSSRFSAMQLLWPPTLAEQAEIAAVLTDMDTEISAIEARSDKTRKIKQGMMQELLTGKMRLVAVGGANA